MTVFLSLDRRLALVTEQSAALQTAAAGADLTAPVPSCPDWTLRELVEHHGDVLRGWAAVVAAADPTAQPAWMASDDAAKPWEPMPADWELWYLTSRALLHDAVSDAGLDAPAWTWWGEPATAGAIARHQVQEACVHRWDAQVAAGLAPDPLPDDAAEDGVEEILTVSLAAEPPPWDGAELSVALEPHQQPGWLLTGADGLVRARPLAGVVDRAAATVTGTASDLVLLLYGRLTLDELGVEGDAAAAARLLA